MQAIRSANYGGGGTSGGGGEAELRLLTLKKRLDEAVAENAMWKRQFATRLEEKLAERLSALGQPSSVAVGSSAPKPRPAAAPAPASSVTAAASATAASAAGKDGAAGPTLAAVRWTQRHSWRRRRRRRLPRRRRRRRWWRRPRRQRRPRWWRSPGSGRRGSGVGKAEKAAKEKAEVAARTRRPGWRAPEDAAEKVAAATKRAEKAEKGRPHPSRRRIGREGLAGERGGEQA